MLLSPAKSRQQIAENLRLKRLMLGLTQEGLSLRAGVALATLRKFEQRGHISLESFLKVLHALNLLERVVEASTPEQNNFTSIDEVIKAEKSQIPKKGWLK